MHYSAEKKTVYVTVDELISLGARSGSIAEADPVFDKPRQAAAMCDSAAEKYPDAEQFSSASCRIIHHGITYAVTAEAELCIKTDDGIHLYSFAAQGGRQEPDDAFCRRHAQRLAVNCGVFAHDFGRETHGELILRYAQGKPDEHYYLSMSSAEMKESLAELIRLASDLIAFEIERIETRIPACLAVRFPFPAKREGQSDFMTEAYRSMKHGGRLLCEAPTGIGKTVSALFPAVRALGHGYIDKIFYLTPKTTAQAAAQNALRQIAGSSLAVRSVSLTAKEKLCTYEPAGDNGQNEDKETGEHTPERKCELCPMSRGFYERVRDAILWLLDRTRYIAKEDILEASKRFSVCPYELSLEVSEYCDAIICDYNYLFDPRVYLRRYFDTEGRILSSCVKRITYGVLIDEVHNLPERAKSMYSHTFSAERIRRLCTAFGKTEQEIHAANAAYSISELLSSYRRQLNENPQKTEHGEVYAFTLPDTLDAELLKQAEEYVRTVDDLRKKHFSISNVALDGYYDFKDFLAKSEWFSKRFQIVCERYDEKIYYRMLCLDAADIIDSHLGLAKGAVLFSATLTPQDYYAEVLGCADAVKLVLPSPYERENLMLTVFDRLSTRYVHREDSAELISDIIFKTVSAQMGNYIIYFPSYRYLTQICQIFSSRHPEIAVLVQSRNMTEWQRDKFIETFEPEPKRTLVGFCVLGGVFAEGIDLVGRRLIGTVIVGVGLPRVSLERDLLARYYGEKDADGFLYSYVYPGMTRILQAVGRVIRTETDRGVAILIDDRFAEPRYRMLFPEHWRHAKFCEHTRSLERLLSRFWGTKSAEGEK
ncbi:MAG: ATP-dependent DNA helicase [Eubacteriales bacterium]|nr:ATP-dependent DNA helicase [Eubacteriales bacterium]